MMNVNDPPSGPTWADFRAHLERDVGLAPGPASLYATALRRAWGATSPTAAIQPFGPRPHERVLRASTNAARSALPHLAAFLAERTTDHGAELYRFARTIKASLTPEDVVRVKRLGAYFERVHAGSCRLLLGAQLCVTATKASAALSDWHDGYVGFALIGRQHTHTFPPARDVRLCSALRYAWPFVGEKLVDGVLGRASLGEADVKRILDYPLRTELDVSLGDLTICAQ